MEPVFAPARDAESPRIIDLSDNLKRAAAGSPGVERKILLQCDDTAEAALLAAELEAIEAERRASFHDYSSLLAEGTVREGEWYSDGLVRGPRPGLKAPARVSEVRTSNRNGFEAAGRIAAASTWCSCCRPVRICTTLYVIR